MANPLEGRLTSDTVLFSKEAPKQGFSSIFPDKNVKIEAIASQPTAPAEATIRTKDKFFQDMVTVQEREGVNEDQALELVSNYYIQKGYTVEGVELAPSVTEEAPEEITEPVSEDMQGLDIGVKTGEVISDIGKKAKFFQSEVDDNVIESGLKFLGNLPGNTIQIGGDLISAISNPVGTVESVGELIGTAAETGLNKAFSTQLGQDALRAAGASEEKLREIREEGAFTTEERRELSDAISAEASRLTDEPGRVKELLVENPADVLLTITGGLGVAKNAARSKGMTGLAQKLEAAENLTNPIKLQADAIKGTKTAISKTKQAIFPEKNLDDLVLEISQGKTQNIPAVKESLSKLDTRNIDTYKDLNARISEKIGDIAKKQDDLLPKAEVLKIDDLTTTQGKRTTNFVKNALDDLEDVGNRENDLDLLNKVDEFADKERLSVKDINDLARFYGSEFKTKSFDKLGNQKSSITAARFENIRKGLKNKSRELLPDDTVKVLDDELSKLFETKTLTEKMAENVVNLQKKVAERGLFESAARGLGRAIDIASLGTARGFLTSFLPSNVGNKVLNSIALEGNLAKNLKKLEKLNKEADKLSEKDFSNRFVEIIKDIAGEKGLEIEAITSIPTNEEE